MSTRFVGITDRRLRAQERPHDRLAKRTPGTGSPMRSSGTTLQTVELSLIRWHLWWAMGVSISRPPRCERGALPTELIALGAHNLSAGHCPHTCCTEAPAVQITGRARRALGVEIHHLDDLDPLPGTTCDLDGEPVGSELDT